MSEISSLHGRCVLVAEDEYLLAEDLRERFEEAGATVLGPVPSLGEALALIEAEAKIDGAVLDLNLAGEMVFPAADALSKRGVPFVFTTGYDERTMPERYGHVTRCEKPFEPADLVRALIREMAA
jgi:CheY-like chemotaxis protein